MKFDWCGFSEINKYAKQVYQKHFPESEDLGGVKTINLNGLPKINLVTFGFPCTDLSVAGKRKGLHGEQSSLFFEAMRIIEFTKPDIFIFENVKGLFSSNNGRDFEKVLQTIADIRLYECEWELINTRWFLPQNRERVFLVGHHRERSRPKVFPITESDFKASESRGKFKDGLWVQSIDSSYYKGADGKRTMIQIVHTNKSGTQTPHEEAQALRSNASHNYQTVHAIKGDLFSRNNPGRQGGIDDKNMFALRGAVTHGVANEIGIRRLTPKECARLQGFSDNWCEGISDSQAYKCYGNAVSVPVVKMIGEKLIN